ncbi:3-phenylpropionic acid transporter [Rhodopseudomonas palustris]|uniref:3-phenylpropionic acid transporter n=1 Tax=Rhodopseudomonas palustris TaxID=1076 RepID=A0A0D7F265_RHOPL|nr:3-phenylpropionic acid transporter [Rhodopseudomonas palustris]
MEGRLEARRFAIRLALFYGASFGVVGTYLPFFTVWLKAIGIDAWWIGVIVAVPAVTRFTILPFITGFAERRQALRGVLMIAAILTAAGFAAVGFMHQALALFVVFVLTACAWTPIVPLTDGYALKGVARYGLNYGPLRLWGSAAFVVGALACGLLADVISEQKLIWVIAAVAGLSAMTSFGLRPLHAPATPLSSPQRSTALLRSPGFFAIIMAAALIQGSHAAYYTFASIAWQGAGISGMTIAALWVLGVIAEIVVFALSPRFALAPSLLVAIGALSAVLRWLIIAQDPPLAALAVVQLLHGLSFGLTQVGTMALLIRHVPGHMIARAQGYLTACVGIVMSSAAIACGAIYAQQGLRVYDLMAAMAMVGALVMLLGRRRLDADAAAADQPHSAGSGG